MLPEGGAEHLLLVPDPQQVHAQQGAVVQQAPLEVPLEGWLRARGSPGLLDADHPSPRLQGREEGEEESATDSLLFVCALRLVCVFITELVFLVMVVLLPTHLCTTHTLPHGSGEGGEEGRGAVFSTMACH